MLFFQYWATFFSSVMIMFVLVYYIFTYGTTEWIILNLLNKIFIKFYASSSFLNNVIICAIFIFAFLIKIGFTPLQLYKIEVYKGLPYIAIFFYTTFYFLVFFMFFILLLVLYLNSFVMYWWYLLLFIIVFGGVYIISLLFDINYIKAFFAYSTMVNSMGFIIISLALLV
jgi:NADH:ubiquinone oxidoreductase subunit 2 (subunit N)